jgi:hypothetical protein
MNNIDKFYNLLDSSKISLLGYKFREESLKDELLSKIPHIKVSDIDSSFNLKSIIRDNKIESLIGNKYLSFNFVVIDINIKTKNNMLDQLSILNMSIKNIAYQFYDSEYKLIITSPVPNGTSIYVSDVAFNIESDKIKILKNRYSEEKEISIKGLKEYNYEYNK